MQILPNNPAGHRRFLAMLAPGTHVVCESTGHYHRALVATAHAAGVAKAALRMTACFSN